MNQSQPKPPTPKALKAGGRKLWAAILGDYALRPDELAVLETACRCADVVAAIDEEMKTQPLIVKGSMGQVRENPLLAEQRLQSAQLARALGQLKLPDLPGEATGSNRYRNAALSRWSQTHGPRAS